MLERGRAEPETPQGEGGLAGLGTILAILPINMWAMRELERVQKANMMHKDARVHAVSELLAGIRVDRAGQRPAGRFSCV